MQITRFEEAKPYSAPLHFGMVGLRLQGAEATKTDNFWVGLSQFLPGGGAAEDSSDVEKVYTVISGEITILQEGRESVLRALDSCCIAAHELRSIENRTNQTVSMLVMMPYPKDKDND
jgi:quercetin dioxygenase-like cupin family protein